MKFDTCSLWPRFALLVVLVAAVAAASHSTAAIHDAGSSSWDASRIISDGDSSSNPFEKAFARSTSSTSSRQIVSEQKMLELRRGQPNRRVLQGSRAVKSSKASKASKSTSKSNGNNDKELVDNPEVVMFDQESPKSKTESVENAKNTNQDDGSSKKKKDRKPKNEDESTKELFHLEAEDVSEKSSFLTSWKAQLFLGIAFVAVSLTVHFVRMKRSTSARSGHTAGGAYKPLDTGASEIAMTELGGPDGMDDEDDEDMDAEYGEPSAQ